MYLALALVLSTALLAEFYFQNKEEKIQSHQVLTWDCEYPVSKPETIMIYCGDGGAYISKIKWDTWNSGGASGSGVYFRNLCNPDCADGKIVHAPVNVRLDNLTPRKGKYYLRTLDMRSATGKDFPWGESGVFTWDVMEFAIQMDEQ